MRCSILFLGGLLAFPSALCAPPGSHAVAGTSLAWFSRVDDGVYKGSKPKRDADFKFLRAHGVRYILELNFLPHLSSGERRKARQYGMTLLSVPMNASPVQPSEKHAREALTILHDARYQPVYFHCVLGHDRTAMVAALYEMCFKGLSPDRVKQAMRDYGFRHSWMLYGLKSFAAKEAKRAQQARARGQEPSVCLASASATER